MIIHLATFKLANDLASQNFEEKFFIYKLHSGMPGSASKLAVY